MGSNPVLSVEVLLYKTDYKWSVDLGGYMRIWVDDKWGLNLCCTKVKWIVAETCGYLSNGLEFRFRLVGHRGQ